MTAIAEKTANGVAKETSIRLRNTLTSQIQKGAEDSDILLARNYLVKCFSNLEEANTKYLLAALIDIEENQEENLCFLQKLYKHLFLYLVS